MHAPRKFTTRSIKNHLLIGGLSSFVLAGSLLTRAETTQHPGRSQTLSTYIQCPAYPVSGKSPISLHAGVSGTEDNEILKDIVFKWNVAQASIVSGQGTRNIVLDPSVKSGVSEIRIALEIEGGPPYLVYHASCVLSVNSECSLAPMIDQYSAVSIDQERKHLDRMAQQLKSGSSESIGYIVSYAGRMACINESEWRAKRARQYLIESHSIPSSRLVIVEAGFRETWTVELFIQPRPACGPLPNPTLVNTDARVRGRCGETQ